MISLNCAVGRAYHFIARIFFTPPSRFCDTWHLFGSSFGLFVSTIAQKVTGGFG